MRLRLLLAGALTATVAAGIPSPAIAVPDGAVAIGDSVMLGARDALRDRGIGVDAQTSRQSYAGPAALRRKGAELPRDVVVHLGTNGPFPEEVCQRVVRAAGPERVVHLVTIAAPRRWVRANNAVIRSCAASFGADRVRIVDWAAAAARHPGWLYSDGIHLRPEGARAYARLVAASLARP